MLGVFHGAGGRGAGCAGAGADCCARLATLDARQRHRNAAEARKDLDDRFGAGPFMWLVI